MLPYSHELDGYYYFVSSFFGLLVNHYIISIIAFILIYLMVFAVLDVSFPKGSRLYRFLEIVLFFPAPNAGLFINKRKHPTKLPFNPLKKMFVDGNGDLVFLIMCVSVLALLCHYLWFIFLFKFFLLGIMFMMVAYMLIYGHLSLMMTVLFTIFLNWAYFHNFSLGFPTMAAHQDSDWIGWIFNHGEPMIINPRDYPQDLNKYVYVFFLFFCYLTLIRYIMNGFYWKMVKHKPNPYFYQFYSDKELQAKTTVKSKSEILNSDKQDTKICGTANPSSENQAESLKLMGFKRETILLIQTEYAKEVVERTLSYLKTVEELTDPKATFFTEIARFKQEMQAS